MVLSLEKYEVRIGDLAENLSTVLEKQSFSRIMVLVDENTRQHCWPILQRLLPSNTVLVEISSGEAHKNIDTCQLIWQAMLDQQLDRNALLINLGGGVIGDMGGFCAGTYKRGIAFLQIPTTLLSQVDASIGGKLGIDFAGFKNVVGLFNDPLAVLIEPAFLKTLPARELRSGFAEIIKHALIEKENQWREMLNWKDLSQVDWGEWIKRSVQVKKEIVEKDPFERDVRKKLNFGHTIGHAVESYLLTTDQPLLHGEAVAWGMMAEAVLSQDIGMTPKQLEELMRWLQGIYQLPPLDSAVLPGLIPLMLNDKKNEAGRINFTMLKAPGFSLINQTAKPEQIIQALERVNSFLQTT